MLLLAALLFPVAVLLSRLSLRGASLSGAITGVKRRTRRVAGVLPRMVPKDPGERAGESPAEGVAVTPKSPPRQAARGPVAASQSVNELLSRKRARNQPPPDPDDDAS